MNVKNIKVIKKELIVSKGTLPYIIKVPCRILTALVKVCKKKNINIKHINI